MRVLLLPLLFCASACAPSSVQTDYESVLARPNFQLTVVPVLPKLIKGNLSEPSSLHFGL